MIIGGKDIELDNGTIKYVDQYLGSQYAKMESMNTM